MILVSACLCGINCKYSGGNNIKEDILKLLKEGKAIPVCPEQLGGLKTPRMPSEIISGSGSDVLKGKAKVMNSKGVDLSFEFIKGAEETLKIAKIVGAKKAILKSNSPSCGFGFIYDGSFSGSRVKGNGVTAELLLENGIEVICDEE
ncbi:DUF523 domain-containing protein [Haloimpatiens sp. FM7315]|uniref:DUF523 domain-containing protein n=1 Tax=Haloimpatiens sp. FM7315 TaxID=3298609 RepID=UPI0035A3093D